MINRKKPDQDKIKQIQNIAHLLDVTKFCVYEFRNIKTHKSYIGCTKHGLFGRMREHFCLLLKGAHLNKKLQQDFDLSSPPDWVFRILEYDAPNMNNNPRERETYWINRLGAYNLAPKSGKQLRQEEWLKIALDIKKGMKYRDIAQKHKVALGTVGNVAKRYGLSRKPSFV